MEEAAERLCRERDGCRDGWSCILHWRDYADSDGGDDCGAGGLGGHAYEVAVRYLA